MYIGGRDKEIVELIVRGGADDGVNDAREAWEMMPRAALEKAIGWREQLPDMPEASQPAGALSSVFCSVSKCRGFRWSAGGAHIIPAS